MNEFNYYEVVFKILKSRGLPNNELSVCVSARKPFDASAAAILQLVRDPERAVFVDSIITVDRILLLH